MQLLGQSLCGDFSRCNATTIIMNTWLVHCWSWIPGSNIPRYSMLAAGD